MVVLCRCEHEYQDKIYGHGMRVFNPLEDDKWRCTVCLREQLVRKKKVEQSTTEEQKC